MDSVLRECRRKEAAHARFPVALPLTAFEEYMLRDDRPNYPMNIIARLRFAGQLDRRATAAALEHGCRTPSPAAGQDSANSGGPSGMGPAADRLPSIPWLDGPDTIACPDAADRSLFGTRFEGLGRQRSRSIVRCRCRYTTRPATARPCSKSSTTSCKAMPMLVGRKDASIELVALRWRGPAGTGDVSV